ncbi:MAG: hypothetical protein JXQ23_04430 [Clostridia bacterium]|nr:hypothetical protein [Clostridia bacterium]
MREFAPFRNISVVYEEGKVMLTFIKAQRHREKYADFQVYRVTCDDYLFNEDYEDYQNHISFEQSVLIDHVRINPEDSTITYRYEDCTVREGVTYAYYLKTEGVALFSGPVLVRPRNNKLWMPYKMIENEMNKLLKSYPDLVSIRNHGYSIRQKEINSITIGNKENIGLSFVGLIHAGESGPELMLSVIKKLLLEQKELLFKTGISFLMNANPDERERNVKGVPWYLRVNANGVDINRNFESGWEVVEYGYGLDTSMVSSPTYRGAKPLSEPETRAVADFIDFCHADVMFSFHCLSSICTDSFLVSKYAENNHEYIEKCMLFLKPYTKGFGVKDKVSIYYGTSYGSLPHWLYEKYEMPAFDLELGDVSDEIKDMVIHDRVTEELLDEYSNRHYKGICEVLKNVYR